MRGGLGAILVKSAVFIVVTVLATGALLVSISHPGTGGPGYRARFTDVASLTTGDDVRMAGVRVGQVTGIGVVDQDVAEVRFTVMPSIHLAGTVTASIRYLNLVGQRYLDLDQGAGSPDSTWPATATIGLDRTTPALDLTALFNGFQPLFRALDATEVNQLSYEIIQIFQGQGSTIADLATQTASLTSTLADKDAVIGEVIDNLNAVLTTVNQHGAQLTGTLSSLQQLVSGLAADRTSIGSALGGIADLTTSVGGLLTQARPDIQTAIESLGALSGTLAAGTPQLQSFLTNLPTKLNDIGRLASYGSWVNTYVCSIGGRIPVPTDYLGGVGIHPVAPRCQG